MRKINSLLPQSPISKTLLIPLMARAGEAIKANPVIKDEKAAKILSQIDVDDINIDGGEISTLGILARTIVIDEEVGKLLVEIPDLTILNLGVGLDTRIGRIDNGRLQSYDLDLPEVIELRRKFFAESERFHFISGSVFDSDWTKVLDRLNSEKIVIIAEGLLMYFSEQEVRQLLHMLADRFPDAQMFFDVVHSYFVGKGISSVFQWGMDNAMDVERLEPNVRLVQSWSTGKLLKNRQSLFFRMMNILPNTRNRSQILHIRFESEVQ